MKRIGIVTDAIRYPKIREFIGYLNERAEVDVVLAEERIMDFDRKDWDFDVVLAKCKGAQSLALLTGMQAAGIPVINTPRSIFMTCHRFIQRSFLAASGIPSPDFALSLSNTTPFAPAIIKGHYDDSAQKITPYINIESGELSPSADEYCYSEEFIEPEIEYKVYGIGNIFFTYVQKCPLIYKSDYRENKHALRSPVRAPEAEELGRRAARVMGLTICSMDVISSGGELFLVDLNSSPSLTDERVIHAVSDLLLEAGP